MKKCIVLLGIFCFLFTINGISQKPSPLKYFAATIADSLLKDADIVTRYANITFDIDNIGEAKLKVHYLQTVLNEKGKPFVDFYEMSDKFSKMEDAEITIYDAMGKKLNAYKKKEMFNVAYGSGLVADGNITYFTVSTPFFPITIETEYTLKYKGLLFYPGFFIQRPYESVEDFNYTITAPAGVAVRHLVTNSKLQPTINDDGKKRTLGFAAGKLKALPYEEESGGAERYFPRIYLSPSKFKMDEFEGDLSTWNGLGVWRNKLISYNNQLNEEGQALVKQITAGATTDREKARLLYKYMQENMRYVSIQLGIGGWRPFPADFVMQKKYGDCKALSNFMQAALSAVGVKSHYAIINAGSNAIPLDPQFPINRTNHAILCIPQPKDSIWLECTSSINDFGELGYFTENRYALLVTETGGVMVSTPKSKAANNVMSVKTEVSLNEDGGGTTNTVIKSTGNFKETMVANTFDKTEDEKRKFIVPYFELKQPDEIKVSHTSRSITPYETTLQCTYDKIIMTKAGSKMFVPTRLYNFFDEKIKNTKRRYSYFFEGPYIKKDTTVIHLPAGYTPEAIPEKKAFKTDFGNYAAEYKYNAAEQSVTIISYLQIDRAEIKADEYQKLYEFKTSADNDLKSKIVIKQQ